MENKEIAKELLVAMINKLPAPNTINYADTNPASSMVIATWIGKSYEVILDAVMKSQEKYIVKK